MRLDNISKDFTIDSIKKTELKGSVIFFSVDLFLLILVMF